MRRGLFVVPTDVSRSFLLGVSGRVLAFLAHILAFHDVLLPLPLALQANKHFHIYAGWFAYVAGFVQCYRGLMKMAGSERLVFSAADLHFSVSYSRIPPPTCARPCLRGCAICPPQTQGYRVVDAGIEERGVDKWLMQSRGKRYENTARNRQRQTYS